MTARTVTVTVPDRDDAEGAVRMVAEQLNAGINVAVIPIPPPLAFADADGVWRVIAEAQAKLSVLACIAARRN